MGSDSLSFDTSMHLLATGDHLMSTLEGWIQAGGPFMLFGILFVCGLGIPLPEDIPLTLAGAAVRLGYMHPVAAAFGAWFGIIAGDCLLYHLGKKFGLGVTKLPVVGKHLTAERIEKVEGLFDKYGIWVIAIGRLFAGIRGAVVVSAGAIKYKLWKFVLVDSLAAIVSGGFFMVLGYYLAGKLNDPATIKTIKEVKLGIFLGALLLTIIVVAFFWWRSKRPHRSLVDRMVDKADAKQHRAAVGVHEPVRQDEASNARGTARKTPVMVDGIILDKDRNKA